MRWWQIYGLVDPSTRAVRYVGFTFSTLADRLRRHINDSKRTHCPHGKNKRAKWVRGLLRRRLQPEIVVLQAGCGDHLEMERFWISLFQSHGTDLVNSKTGPKVCA